MPARMSSSPRWSPAPQAKLQAARPALRRRSSLYSYDDADKLFDSGAIDAVYIATA